MSRVPQETICNLYIIDAQPDPGWLAMLEREGTVSEIGTGNTPGEALDLCVKWARDRGLFPCVDATGFRVIKEDPRARSV